MPDYQSQIPLGDPAAIVVHHPARTVDELEVAVRAWLGGTWETLDGRRRLALPFGTVTVVHGPDGVHLLLPEGRPPMPSYWLTRLLYDRIAWPRAIAPTRIVLIDDECQTITAADDPWRPDQPQPASRG
ncbi:MAG: hypothetical protein QM662_11115 [Gordonia sp. (in: high G+C Gram-positive bacteria)]